MEMDKTPVFISYDYDQDRDLKELLVGQSRLSQSPFSIGLFGSERGALVHQV
jgi:hypothetical protein